MKKALDIEVLEIYYGWHKFHSVIHTLSISLTFSVVGKKAIDGERERERQTHHDE